MNIKDTLIAALVPIFLGFGFVVAKPAFESFPPILLMGIRFMFAASILIWWFPIPKGYLKKIFIASLIANTLQYSITYTGLNLIDASAAVLLVQTEVPFGVIFAYFMLKEKPTIRALVWNKCCIYRCLYFNRVSKLRWKIHRHSFNYFRFCYMGTWASYC